MAKTPVVTTIELHNAMAGSTKSAVGTAAELFCDSSDSEARPGYALGGRGGQNLPL